MPLMKRLSLIALLLIAATCRAQDVLPGVNRIVFLGDSITYDGKYVAYAETELLLRFPGRRFEIQVEAQASLLAVGGFPLVPHGADSHRIPESPDAGSPVLPSAQERTGHAVS